MALASAVAGLAAPAAAQRSLLVSVSPDNAPVSVPFDTTLRPKSDDLPMNDPLVAKRVKGCGPEQVRVCVCACVRARQWRAAPLRAHASARNLGACSRQPAAPPTLRC